MNPLFINTVLLGGHAKGKLRAAREAGFDQVELWTSDVADLGGAGFVRQQAHGLGFTDYQVLLDFDGAPPALRPSKRAEALTMLDTAAEIGIGTVLAPASTDPNCEPQRVAEDLSWLIAQAAARGLRIAYEGMAWSSVNPSLSRSWAAIRDFDPVHSGIVVDAYHLFVGGEGVDVLDTIPPERIFLVQLSDVVGPIAHADAKHVARHARLLPGDGTLPLPALIRRLLERDYVGPIGLEVFNDDLSAAPATETARKAMRALTELLRGV